MKNSRRRIQVALFTALITLCLIAIVGCGNSATPQDTINGDTTNDLAEVQSDIPGTDTNSDSIDVTGEVVQTGSCKLEVVPKTLNFGTEPVGFTKDKEIRLVNTGTGPCTITAFKIAECPVESGYFVCPDPLEGNDSAVFTLKSPATMIGVEVAPGASSSMTIEFSGINETVGDIHAAMISVEVEDAAGSFVIPECGTATDTECTPTMDISVYVGPFLTPTTVEFGIRIAECEQSKRQACVFNNGPEVSLESLAFEGCSLEFILENISETTPVNLQANKLTCADLTYTPTDEGTDTCKLVWTIDGETLETTLIAIGAVNGSNMDSFTVTEGQVEFKTSGIPRGGITATINTVACNDGWTIGGTADEPTVIAAEPCIPAAGDAVEIHYDIACPD